MVRLASIACLAISLTVLTPAASAQKAPVQRGVTSADLAQQVTDMREQVADIRQQNAQLNLENDRLEQEIADANGKIETLQFLLSQSRDEINRMQQDDSRIGAAIESIGTENENLAERVKQLESDIDMLIAYIESGEAGTPADQDGEAQQGEGGPGGDADEPIVRNSSAPAGGAGNNPETEGTLGQLRASDLPGEAGPLFAAAKSKLLNFDFEGAETAFRAFIQKFGDDPQAGEAQYWLAEALYQQDAYAESGKAYTQMIREYPNHARAPDALVKLARSMRYVGDMDKACNALNILPKQYPNASGVTRNLAALERTRAKCDA